jgi:hypothetical protein
MGQKHLYVERYCAHATSEPVKPFVHPSRTPAGPERCIEELLFRFREVDPTPSIAVAPHA